MNELVVDVLLRPHHVKFFIEHELLLLRFGERSVEVVESLDKVEPIFAVDVAVEQVH